MEVLPYRHLSQRAQRPIDRLVNTLLTLLGQPGNSRVGRPADANGGGLTHAASLRGKADELIYISSRGRGRDAPDWFAWAGVK